MKANSLTQCRLMTAQLHDSQPPGPQPSSSLSLSPSFSLFFLCDNHHNCHNHPGVKRRYLGHFNQSQSDLIKGQDGLCGREAAGRKADTQSHTRERTRARHTLHTPRARPRRLTTGESEMGTFPSMPQNKEQGQILWERPRDSTHPQPHQEPKAFPPPPSPHPLPPIPYTLPPTPRPKTQRLSL